MFVETSCLVQKHLVIQDQTDMEYTLVEKNSYISVATPAQTICSITKNVMYDLFNKIHYPMQGVSQWDVGDSLC